MKLTAHRRQWIQDKTNHYCHLLQVEPPLILLRRKEYEEWKAKRKEEKRQGYLKMGITTIPNKYIRIGRNASRYQGVCHTDDKMIYLNVKKSSNLNDLDHTLRHELIHYAKPSYQHYTKPFVDRMERLKKGKISNGRFI